VKAAGITDVVIVVGDTSDEVQAAVGGGGEFGLQVRYIRQEAPLGLAHAVKVSKDSLGDEPFVMYLGDNLLKNGIKSFVDEFRSGGCDAQILLARVPNPEEFGVAELKDGRVVGLEEKPRKPKSQYALVGVYMFTSSIFEAVENIEPSFRKELEITDAIQYLIDKGCVVRSHVVDGWWKDTGKLEDILDANRMILNELEPREIDPVPDNSEIHGNVQVDKGVLIERSILRGPCIVGRGARIIDSFIGPFTSIGQGTIVEGSEIENSIVLADCKIRKVGIRIESSLIGRNVVIAKNEKPPKAYKFMIGDNSNISLI